MSEITLAQQITAVVHALLEDVAENPSRLVQAQKLATDTIKYIVEGYIGPTS